MGDHRELGGKLHIHGKTYAIFGGLNPIGRNREAVVNIKHLGVSQNHALLILVDDDLHFISDLNSSNGTYLNGEKLSPLQLYRVDSGYRLKFADIEGTYIKCCSDDDKFLIPNNSQCTQNQTQNFYGSDTQIMGDTTVKVDRKSFVKNTHYVATQDLANVASALETSYVALHEQPTQLPDPPSYSERETQLVEEMKEEIQNVNISIDLHEAETQKVSESQFLGGISEKSLMNRTDIHEIETQLFPQETRAKSQSNSEKLTGARNNSSQNLEDSDLDIIKPMGISSNRLYSFEEKSQKVSVESALGDSDSDIVRPVGKSTNKLNFSESRSQTGSQKSSENRNGSVVSNFAVPLGMYTHKLNSSDDSDLIGPVGLCINMDRAGFQVSNAGDNDSDLVRPVGISTNRLNISEDMQTRSSQEYHLEESEPDIVRPLGKSINKLSFLEDNSQECIDTKRTENTSENSNPTRKSANLFESQETPIHNENNEIEDDDDGSNDSLDFMTMQKISDVDKKCPEEKADDDKEEEPKGSIPEIQQTSDSETDNEQEEIFGNVLHESSSKKDSDKGSSEKMNAIKNAPEQSSGSETEIETEISTNSHRRSNRKRKNKIQNKILDSDSDSEIETEFKKNKSSKSDSESDDEIIGYKKKCGVFYSQSDTDIEHNGRNSLLLESSAALVIDETKLDDSNFAEQASMVKVYNPMANDSLKPDYYLDESDIIPATQECNSKPIKSISQDSKFENSEESFKLGLTQLMDDEFSKNEISQKQNTPLNGDDGKENDENNDFPQNVQSQNSQKVKKVFVFKKPHISPENKESDSNCLDDDIYEAKTQSLFEESSNVIKDDHIFLQPTQKSPSKKKIGEKDDIYMVSTQKLTASPSKSLVDNFYMQSTQKLSYKIDPGEGPSGVENTDCEVYQQDTQKLSDTNEEKESKDEDFDDMFASQQANQKTTPSKRLESQLAFMFNTQRSLPTEESLETIKSVLHQNQIVDSKLPEGDSDLEAILASQKISESPKTSRGNSISGCAEKIVGRSIESQLEVLFASQVDNLPTDKFDRPLNPLVNIFGEDTQEIEAVNANQIATEKVEKNENDFSECSRSSKEENPNIYSANETSTNLSESSRRSTRGNMNNALEQSFALLESKCSKVRRSGRTSNLEEITVSCRKSRVSMAVAPNDTFKRIIDEKTSVNEDRSKFKEPLPKREIGGPMAQKKTTKRSLKQNTQENECDSTIKKSKEGINTRIKKSIIPDNENSDIPSEKSILKAVKGRQSKTLSKRESYIESPSIDVQQRAISSATEDDPSSIEPLQTIESKSETRTSSRRRNKKNDDTNSDDVTTKPKENTKTKRSKLNMIDENEDSDTSSETSVSKGNKGRKSRAVIKKESDVGRLSKGVQNKKGSTRYSEENDSSSTSSSGTIESKSVCATPARKRHQNDPNSFSNGDIDFEDTPSRKKRKLKPKVVFTMMENPKLESEIRQLGGSIVDSINTATVLITPCVKRSLKLLSAVGLGKPICSMQWVEDSKREHNFLDPWDHILVDKEAETKWDFSLKTSLERSSHSKLFEGYSFQLLVTAASDVLKGAIETCGGKIVSRSPKVANKFVVVASDAEKEKYKKLLKQQPKLMIVEPEAIFDGVLRQEIRFERHLLH